jgi:3-oxoadipate enol-lactonase
MLLHHRIEGSGPTVVLLHPVGLDLTCFDGLVPELTPRFQVIRADMRGHGRSPAVSCDVRLADYADDVHDLLIALGLAPAAVVGFSFGGMIAQSFGLAHASDVGALVIGACPSTLSTEQREMMLERGTAAVRLGMEAVAEPTMRRWFTPAFLGSDEAQAVRQRLVTDDVRGWAAAWRAISELDTQPDLGSIAVPTLCVAGEMDTAAPPEVVQAVAAAIPNARFVVIRGTSHMLFIEQPRAVGAAIATFLAEAF